jgi:Domain of unknown function (DUF6429)
MDIDKDRIDDAVLALLYLTLHEGERAWKGFDFDALDRLHEKGMIEEARGSSKSVVFTPDGMERSKRLFESMFTKRAVEQSASQPPTRIDGNAKYPAIKVELSDLGNQMWPILRRVSYAMSDADVDDAEIEQYKSEMKAGGDPVGVSSRWVTVEAAAAGST